MSQLDVSRPVRDWKKATHHGAGEWLAERGTSLALIPLTLWCVWAACQIVGGGYDAALAFVKVPLHTGLMGVTILLSVWHMYMGLKVIIDDYLHGPLRGFLMFLVVALCLVLLIATGGALYACAMNIPFDNYFINVDTKGAA